ncbi:MAG TPA: protein kinase [Myxococcales bacterium]|jgi:serine/threonine-protein kinase
MPDEAANSCSQCGRPLSEVARFCERCGTPTHVAGDDGMQPIREGDVLDGKWRIERKLGTGGMGTVFLALDLALDRRVAIKALAPALCADTEFLARFEREARATAKLEHPNIVPVYAVARHFGRPFIVMKRLTGRSLAYWLKGIASKPERPGRDTALSLLRQMAAGLGAIHAAGFVHRDLKPGNVYVGEDGHVTILDFGILRDSGSGQHLTRTGVPLGTPHYMAPEQASGAKDVDGRADTYALGTLFFEILCGAPPFDDPDPGKLMRLHATAPPPDVRAHVPAVPPGVSLALQKAMAKKRDDRFATPLAFYEAVESEWPAAEKAGLAQPAQAAAPVKPAKPESPAAPVVPLIDEPDSLHGKAGEPGTQASNGGEEIHLTPRKVPRTSPRPLPQPIMQPEISEKDLALPEVKAAKKRTLFIVALVVEALLVVGILAWALWPSPPKDEVRPTTPEPVAEPVTAPKKDPAATTPKPGLKVIDPGLPTNPSDPKGAPPHPSLDPMKPPHLDFKPPEAPAMPKLDPVPGLAPSPSPSPSPAPAPTPTTPTGGG